MRRQRVATSALSFSAAAVLAACGGDAEIDAVAIDAPPPARIGNVASAQIEPASDSSVSGTATFAQLDDALRVEVTVTGLSSGRHGVHLHEDGDCSAPDADSAGSHFSPDDDPHGSPTDDPEQHHAGDLGNLTVGADGTAHMTREDPELTLIGEYGVVGKAVIVHREADDLVSQPGGESGARVACGVIEWGPEQSERSAAG